MYCNSDNDDCCKPKLEKSENVSYIAPLTFLLMKIWIKKSNWTSTKCYEKEQNNDNKNKT